MSYVPWVLAAVAGLALGWPKLKQYLPFKGKYADSLVSLIRSRIEGLGKDGELSVDEAKAMLTALYKRNKAWKPHLEPILADLEKSVASEVFPA